MFDRAPELFGPCRHLSDISDNTVEIFAIPAAYLLKPVQIEEVVSVHDNILASFDLGDLIDGKTDGLINGRGDIEDHGRMRGI